MGLFSRFPISWRPDSNEAEVRHREIIAHLRKIETQLTTLTKQEETHAMAFIDDLEAAVSKQTTVDDSVLTLLEQIKKALDNAGVDPARAQAVIAALTTEQTRIADAVTANTPSAAQ